MVLRWIRRAILFWILFVVGMLVLADFGLRVVAQYVVARQLQTSLSLEDRPKVSFGGWPFVTELIGGDIASVTVNAHGSVTSDQFPIQTLDATLRDVSFSLGNLFSGTTQTVLARGGDGTVVMTEQDSQDAVPSDLGVTVDLKNGKVLLRSDLIKGRVEASVRISNGQLVLESDELPPVELPLPALAGGITFRDVTISGDQATLTFDVKDATFQA
jgi:DUF2993 family protein